MPFTKKQKLLRNEMLRVPVFLFKISHETGKEQSARLHVSNVFQRRTLLRVLRKIAIGEIPMSKDTFLILKSKKKASFLTRLADLEDFKKIWSASEVEQIVTIKRFLLVLKYLLKPLFYQ